MQIHAATGADQPQVEAVVAAAFGGSHGDHVVEMVRALDTTGATRASLVAVDAEGGSVGDVRAGGVVGHVQLSRSWVDARARLVEVAVLSPLAVAPSRQREGIGSALVEAALAEARRQGFPAVFLEGSPDYYGRRGFAAAIPLGFQPPTPRIPAPAFQVALLNAYELWMIGALVYCDAFWSTDSAGLRDPRLAAIEASLAGS